MVAEEVESERLFLKPLSFEEILYINNDELEKIQPSIEEEALSNEIKRAIAKKTLKMRSINEEFYEWITYWLIVNKISYEGIGFIGFKGVPNQSGYTEVGYSISPNYRGKGLMTESLSMLLDWASSLPNCKGITAKALRTNIGSNKVLNNCNFILANSSDVYNNYVITF